MWHIPVLIVQAEPLALFKICIRMLFLYSSKRRHVESLLNRSANRWRFSRCLYEIKWNIPMNKTFPCLLSPFTASLSYFFSSSLSLFIPAFLTFPSFFFWIPRGLGSSILLLKLQWKVDRCVLPITISLGKQAPSISHSWGQTGKQTLCVWDCRQRGWLLVSLLYGEAV